VYCFIFEAEALGDIEEVPDSLATILEVLAIGIEALVGQSQVLEHGPTGLNIYHLKARNRWIKSHVRWEFFQSL
jgi:hypothetical protein